MTKVITWKTHKKNSTMLLSAVAQQAQPLPAACHKTRDLKTLIKGVKLTREILRSAAFDVFRDEEVETQDVETDEQWEHHVRERADTIYHPVGTCKMGIDTIPWLMNNCVCTASKG